MKIYTDGSSIGNPGPSGWAFVVPSLEYSESGHLTHQTNNYMELYAIGSAVIYAVMHHEARSVVIYSDSVWALKSISGEYKSKTHLNLVHSIRAWLKQYPNIKLKYVPGHGKSEGNRWADKLAKEAARMQATDATSGVLGG